MLASNPHNGKLPMRIAAKEANMKKVAQTAQVREVTFEGSVWVGVEFHMFFPWQPMIRDLLPSCCNCLIR